MRRRISLIPALFLSLGGTIALADIDPFFSSRTIAQSQSTLAQSPTIKTGLATELNLTQDQKQKLNAIRNKYKNQLSQTRQSLRKAEQELRELMVGTASANTVRSKHQQVQQLRQQLADLRFNSQLDMREVLTQDQRRKVTQLMEQRQ